ncbi:MAG: septum formation initiator family protein [Candidatus Krumholzibacteriia bacterium]
MSSQDPRGISMGGYVRGQQPARRDGRRTALLAIAFILLGLVVVSQLGENGVISWLRLRGELAALEQEVQALEAANAELRQQIDALANDPETLEKIAREKYNMRAEGEEVLVVLPPRPAEGTPGSD